MKLIRPSCEIVEQGITLSDLYCHIERAGRICYKSEPEYKWYSQDGESSIRGNERVTQELKDKYPLRGENLSAEGFVKRLIKSGHLSVLEHGTVYLRIPITYETSYRIDNYIDNPYSKAKIGTSGEKCYYVVTNLRVLVEHDWLDDLQYLCDPTDYHERRISAHLICDRGVSHELVRHRLMSYSQESTRYCNYSKDKLGNELTYIIPSHLNLSEGYYSWMDNNPHVSAGGDIQEYGWDDCPNVSMKDTDGCYIPVRYFTPGVETFLKGLQIAENSYLELVEDSGWTPQQARAILPNALKTEIMVTGFVSDWKHVFRLRTFKALTGKPHPDMETLMNSLLDKFASKGIIAYREL
jgi:thymidylate synthase (FAD)